MNIKVSRVASSVAPILIAGLLAPASAQAASLVLDFEQFGVTNRIGEIDGGSRNLNGVTTNVGGIDITLGATNTRPAGLPLTTFDASCPGGPTGGDGDLCQDGFNNVLIINERRNLRNPDDDGSRPAGTIGFDFSAGVFLESIALLDTEEEGSIQAFLNGNLVDTIAFDPIANGTSQVIDLSGFATADRLEVSLGGSGALDNVEFKAVPEPTTMLGLALGGGALLAAKRKQRQS